MFDLYHSEMDSSPSLGDLRPGALPLNYPREKSSVLFCCCETHGCMTRLIDNISYRSLWYRPDVEVALVQSSRSSGIDLYT